ncbi:MAG: hypothetical protein L6R45_10070 [Anaerolineae bacterium]|nr:hypothetical protein [Anaerolineae bacterium]
MDLEEVYRLFRLQGRKSITGKQVYLYIDGQESFYGTLLDAPVHPDESARLRPDALWQVINDLLKPSQRVFFRSSHVVSIEPPKRGELGVYRITLTRADDPDGAYAAYQQRQADIEAELAAWEAGGGHGPHPAF